MQEIIYSIGGKFLVNWFVEAGDGSGQRGLEDPENPTADGNGEPRQPDDVQGEIKRREGELKKEERRK